MLAPPGLPGQGRRAVRPAHGDDGAHAARRCRPRPLGARHEALPATSSSAPSTAAPATAAGSASAACASARRARTCGPAERAHQARLSRRRPTAQFGPATRTSVRLFERAAGLRVDGVLTQREVRTLKKAARSGGMAGAVSLRYDAARRPPATAAGGGRRPNQPTGQVAPPPPAAAQVGANGLAVAPAGAPAAIAAIIQAGNVIAHMPVPLRRRAPELEDTGYDCSGSVSYALHGAGLAGHAARLVRLLHLGRARPRPVGHGLRQGRPRLHGRRRPALRHVGQQGRRLALDGRGAPARRATSPATPPVSRRAVELSGRARRPR